MTLEEKTKKLGTLPWQALYDLALAMKIDEEDIKHNEKALIISKIIGISTLEDEQIESLVNDYIYGSRITFTLWSFERILNESEHAIVSGLENVTEHYLDCKGFRNLHIMNVKKYEDRFEVLYTYSKGYKPKTASELIGRPLLSTSTEGQEIIRQFVEQGMNDQRCQVIAIIAPQYFDSGLKGTLRYLARLSHKMITFIELDEVSKIIAMNDKIALS